MSDDRIPIFTNLIRQNCFLRDVTRSSPREVAYNERYEGIVYESIDEVVRCDGSGTDLKLSENSYPITPQYVQSFVDSADYHCDPLAAIANSSARLNLGDVTDYQKINSMDTSEQIKLYQQLQEKFGKLQAEKSSQSSQPSPVPSAPSGE